MTGSHLNEAALFPSQPQEQRVSSFWVALVKENYILLPVVEGNKKINPAKLLFTEWRRANKPDQCNLLS